jgi:hypothetical protein
MKNDDPGEVQGLKGKGQILKIGNFHIYHWQFQFSNVETRQVY